MLSSEGTLDKATTRTLGDVKRLGIEVGTYTKLKFPKLKIGILCMKLFSHLPRFHFITPTFPPELPIKNRTKQNKTVAKIFFIKERLQKYFFFLVFWESST